MDANLTSSLVAPDAFERGQSEVTPFRWMLTERFFRSEIAEELAETFPRTGFTPVRHSGGQSRFDMRTVISDDTVDPATRRLPTVWAEAAEFFASSAYRRMLGSSLGIDLDGLSLFGALCIYSSGGWMAPHTDRPFRVVTQTVYFSRRWEEDWGGCLRVLASNQMDDVLARVVPRLNTSFVFVRSDTSWHGVEPVAENTHAERLSLLLHWSRPERS